MSPSQCFATYACSRSGEDKGECLQSVSVPFVTIYSTLLHCSAIVKPDELIALALPLDFSITNSTKQIGSGLLGLLDSRAVALARSRSGASIDRPPARTYFNAIGAVDVFPKPIAGTICGAIQRELAWQRACMVQ